jgi:restriction endonuclease S subunit
VNEAEWETRRTRIDQVKLNRVAMDRIPVPVAPLAEQQEIARLMEALLALADQIEGAVLSRFRRQISVSKP